MGLTTEAESAILHDYAAFHFRDAALPDDTADRGTIGPSRFGEELLRRRAAHTKPAKLTIGIVAATHNVSS